MKYKTTEISIAKFIKSLWRIVLLIHVKVPKLWLIHCYIWEKTLVNFLIFLITHDLLYMTVFLWMVNENVWHTCTINNEKVIQVPKCSQRSK